MSFDRLCQTLLCFRSELLCSCTVDKKNCEMGMHKMHFYVVAFLVTGGFLCFSVGLFCTKEIMLDVCQVCGGNGQRSRCVKFVWNLSARSVKFVWALRNFWAIISLDHSHFESSIVSSGTECRENPSWWHQGTLVCVYNLCWMVERLCKSSLRILVLENRQAWSSLTRLAWVCARNAGQSGCQ